MVEARQHAQVLVLGIGDVRWADEGFGVRAVEALAARWSFPDSVTVLDAATRGLHLAPYLGAADAVIVLGAVDFGATPGALRVARDAQAQALIAAEDAAPHHSGVHDRMAISARLAAGNAPFTLVAVQPGELEDYGGGLCAAVAAQIGPAIEIALSELSRRHRIHAVARAAAPRCVATVMEASGQRMRSLPADPRGESVAPPAARMAAG